MEAWMGRLVIVSNRVGSSLRGNEGGLATAMVAAFDPREVIWFGWSGEVTDEPAGPTRVYRERRLTRMLVDLERSDYEGYYLEFANCVLWPLFHYRVNLAEYGRERWAAYNRVNEMFAERLAPALEPDDILWVHDYHLMPLGSALRRLRVDNPIGFFLHIPFPAPEVWRHCRCTRRWCERSLHTISSAFRRTTTSRPSGIMSSGKPADGRMKTGRCTHSEPAFALRAFRSASIRG